MNEEVVSKVSKKINLKEYQIKNVIGMLSEGATIPFMARYRKEVTGNLNEDELKKVNNVLKKIKEKYSYKTDKKAFLKLIDNYIEKENENEK